MLRVALIAAGVLGCGCSAGPDSGGAPAQAQPVSAEPAFYKMFFAARSWAADAQPLRVAQIDVDNVKGEPGKAGAWEALFVSVAQRQVWRYVFSAIHHPARNLRLGITAEPPNGWSGMSGAEPFLVQAFRTDSPAAYQVAVKEAREYVRKNPGAPVKFLLEKTKRFPDPAWRVYWGESVSSSGYSVFVDATTGQYLGTGR